MSPERNSNKVLTVPGVSDSGSFGFGVRVIVNGAWGFASSPFVNPKEIVRITGEAVAVAKANSVLQTKPLELAPVAAYRTRWVTPHEKDPFAVPLAEKLDLIRSAANEVKKSDRVFSSSAQLTGTLTLDAQGNPNAVFVFQVGSTLTTASNASVRVINGGSDCNVFWQVSDFNLEV